MDISAFQAAKSAVAKVMKDYQPLVNLHEGLEAVEKAVAELGDIERAKEHVKAEVAKLSTEKEALQKEAKNIEASIKRAQAVYEEIKAKLASIKV